jgi:TRAP-type C4-dicarboxylate transport system permease small subunit
LNGCSAGLRASPAAPQDIAAGGLQTPRRLYQAVIPMPKGRGLGGVVQNFRGAVGRVSNAVNYVGLASLFAMVFIVAIDIILRKLTDNTMSIRGSNELTAYLMVYACVFGIPVLQRDRGHVWVNLLVNMFPSRMKSFWMFVIMLLETLVIAMLLWGALRNVSALIGPPAKLTFVLNMPQWIFAASTIVAFVEYFLLALCDALRYLSDGVKNVVTQDGT